MASKITDLDFNHQLEQKAQVVNDTLRVLIDKQSEIDTRFKKAIEYTLFAQGKRIRPAIVLWCCEIVSGSVNRNAEIAAAAVEMVHTYSLVHDDLPAMDNDDLRRGIPTCHKAFDEATAILVGDAILTLAFEVLADEIDSAEMAINLITQLTKAAGPCGMIAGQAADLKAENTNAAVRMVEYIHTNKTAKMFQCAAVCGAITGQASGEQLKQLSEYGLNIGLAFQIADDILDVAGSSEQMGKTAGKDEKVGKATYPSVIGLEKSRQLEKKFTEQANQALAMFGPQAQSLRQLTEVLLNRTK